MSESAHTRALDADELMELFAATSSVTGAEFFEALVRTLGKVLGMHAVLVGETVNGVVHPLAAWRDGALVAAAPYPLVGTPGELLVKEGPQKFVRDVGRLSPLLDWAGPEAAHWGYLGAPLRRSRGETIGVVHVLGDPDVVAQTDLRMLTLFAERAAAEVERVRAETVRLQHQAALLRLAQIRPSDDRTALEDTLKTAAQALRVERCSYWKLVPDGEAISCERLYCASRDTFDGGARLAATTYPAHFAALRSSQTIAASDALTDPRTSEFRFGYFDTHGIGAMLDVPVWREGRLAGVLCHEHVGGSRIWTDEEQNFARAVANVVSVILEASARTRAERLFETVAIATGEVVWDWNLENEQREWSGSLRTIFGHHAGETAGTGEWWLAHIHPDDRARVESSIRAVLAGNRNGMVGGISLHARGRDRRLRVRPRLRDP